MTKTVTVTKKYQSTTGNDVIITGTLTTEKTVWLDGHEDTIPTCEILVTVNVPAKNYSTSDRIVEMSAAEKKQLPSKFSHLHLVCGRMAVEEWQAEIIRSVRAELETNPAWIARMERIAENEKSAREFENNRRENGYCPKCQSYCHGDCSN